MGCFCVKGVNHLVSPSILDTILVQSHLVAKSLIAPGYNWVSVESVSLTMFIGSHLPFAIEQHCASPCSVFDKTLVLWPTSLEPKFHIWAHIGFILSHGRFHEKKHHFPRFVPGELMQHQISTKIALSLSNRICTCSVMSYTCQWTICRGLC